MAQENGKLTDRNILQRIREFRLMDDAFMRAVFRKNCKAVAEVLRVILEKDDLEVTEVSTEYELSNLYGRSVCLDIAAVDSAGRLYNIEIQRAKEGASPERARLNSSLMDADAARPGMPFEQLPQTWVIFIAETDVLGGDKPLHIITRRIKWEKDGEHCRPFGDGSHIVYVNGAMREGETALARLMRDFFCTDPEEMYYPALAERVRYFKKDEKGVREMYNEIARWKDEGLQEGMELGRIEGRKEGRLDEQRAGAERMIAAGKLALEDIANYSRLSLDEVRAIAAERGNG